MRDALKDIRVLVVEDHSDCRMLMTAVLELHGAVVEAVDTVDEALWAVDDFVPDVIVSDVSMPERDGLQLARTLTGPDASRSHRRIPAVAVTAYNGPSAREASLQAGFRDFLAKPFSAAALVGTVAHLAQATPYLTLV